MITSDKIFIHLGAQRKRSCILKQKVMYYCVKEHV